MHVATIARIPIRLHWSFLGVVALYLVWTLFTQGPWGFVTTSLGAVALFGSVVLHELGHALVARGFGIGTAHITLFPFGGVAAIDRMPRDPRQELWIALAGPLVNAAIVVASLVGWAVAGGGPWLGLAAINGVMAVFNLIPAYPMDGGRVLRAALATRLGARRASEIAMSVGRAFAWVFVGVGLVSGWFSLALVGGFLLLALSAERTRMRHERAWRWQQAAWRPHPTVL